MRSRQAIEAPTYLILAEVAEVVGQSVKTLRRRISAGTFPAYRFGPVQSGSSWAIWRRRDTGFRAPQRANEPVQSDAYPMQGLNKNSP